MRREDLFRVAYRVIKFLYEVDGNDDPEYMKCMDVAELVESIETGDETLIERYMNRLVDEISKRNVEGIELLGELKSCV